MRRWPGEAQAGSGAERGSTMRTMKLLAPCVVGLGLTLACLCLLSAGSLRVARAATFTVTNTNPSGTGSLWQAIVNANASGGHDTIDFGGSVSGTIVLTDSLPTVSDDLSISGPGASVLSISGDNAYQVLDIGSGTAVTISGVTIRDGNAAFGGGIYSLGTLLLVDTEIVSNAADYGGGVYVDEGSVVLSGGQILGNTAADRGGGVFVDDGSATLSGAQVVSNTATNSGGGIYVDQGSATLSGGQIVSNTAVRGGGVCVWSAGAAFTQTGVSPLTHNPAT
ncbi:MAG: hypothetical protein E3J64_01095, partial [Anaerolineales bacterium]